MGALLTVGGGAFLGFDAHRRLKRRARVLRQLAGALEQMDREISFRLTPMPQLMEELADDYPPPVGELFANCRKGMEELGERSLAEIWRQALEDTPLDLEGRSAAVMDELGEVLGRFEESGLGGGGTDPGGGTCPGGRGKAGQDVSGAGLDLRRAAGHSAALKELKTWMWI